MEIYENENMFAILVSLLKHIENVQKDILELTERSAICFHNVLSQNGCAPNQETLEALQYQDIITQQLNAIGETIHAIEKSVNMHIHAIKQDKNMLDESIKKLSSSLSISLESAKKKRDAYKGNSMERQQEDIIEFF